MMTEVLKEMKKYVKTKLTSDCHLSKLDELLVLENLSQSGYEVQRSKSMDLEHGKLSLRAFACLHAASFIMEEKTGLKIDEKYPEIIFETFFLRTPPEEKEGIFF